MALKPSAVLVFTSYEVVDEGITMHFISPDPGPGQPSDWYVLLTDADLATVIDAATFQALVLTKLRRKFRAQGIASKLDARIGASLTI